MIIKIFKISTEEMWNVRHKDGLIKFIEREVGMTFSNKLTISQLMLYLPKENYYRVR